MTERDEGLVKMSELARLSGVPAATIKHYIREGLVTGPAVRTSRNMAWYDPRVVPRIKAIKELQRSRYLPLKVIKEVLEGASGPADDARVAAAITRVLREVSTETRLSRAQLLSAGVSELELRGLEMMGVVQAHGEGEEAYFTGDDLEILQVLKRARKAGLTDAMLPYTIMARYIGSIQELVRIELELFTQGVIPNAGDDLETLSEVATRLSERLVILLRRKLLLPTLRSLFEEERVRLAAAKETEDDPKESHG